MTDHKKELHDLKTETRKNLKTINVLLDIVEVEVLELINKKLTELKTMISEKL